MHRAQNDVHANDNIQRYGKTDILNNDYELVIYCNRTIKYEVTVSELMTVQGMYLIGMAPVCCMYLKHCMCHILPIASRIWTPSAGNTLWHLQQRSETKRSTYIWL